MGLVTMILSLSTLILLLRAQVCKVLTLLVCDFFSHSLMMVLNIPVLLYIGFPSNNTGMWVVEPEVLDNSETLTSIIHLDTIVQASHLLPVFGSEHVSKTLSFTDTLNTFNRFYVDKYIDHHAFKIAS